MLLKQYYLGCLAHASYLIADEVTGTAVVVDPQRDIDQYLTDAEAYGIPLQRLQRQLHEVPRGRKIVVYCAGGYRSSLAVGLLEQHGIATLADLDGGVTAWEDAGLATLGPEAVLA
jgi:rhodanese-related sulfurtransferase